MLQKFLFVGVGGSGGKTLRILRQELQWRLEEVGHSGPFPKAWQFLHIDVPATADGNDPDLPDQLPAGSYVGLASKNLAYRDLDELLSKKGPRALRHSVGWRPDRKEVKVSVAHGAGQYRTVGRVVVAAAMNTVVNHLRSRLSALTHVDVDAELETVSRSFGLGRTQGTPVPTAIVVSSIAGGSGAGSFLDVCDALRMVGAPDRWPGDSVGILYTPDVFDGLDPAERPGVHANALGALSELLAGYWNDDDPTLEEFAFLESAGVAAGRVDRRGPRFPFLVGRSNGTITYTHQNDVYRAVGRSLAAWTTSVQVQDRARAYILTGWPASAANLPDRSGLKTDGRETPLSSLGYASVSLGRDRFRRYAAQRLARAAVEQVLRGHWNEKVPDEQTPESARDELADTRFYPFLERCGLRELGPDWNQILDAIRGGTEMEARKPALRDLKKRIEADVTAKKASLQTGMLVRQIFGRVKDHWHSFVNGERTAEEERAERWVALIQDRLAAETTAEIGWVGTETAVRLLDLAATDLTQAVVPELRQMIDTKRRFVDTVEQRIQGKFANFQGEVRPDNPLVSEAVKEGIDTLWAEAEARMYELVVDLVVDLAENVIRPLREAVERARSMLDSETRGTPERPSEVESWPTDGVPRRFVPAQNEFLLEGVEGYPETFLAKVRATSQAVDERAGLQAAVRTVTAGNQGAADGVISQSGAWVSRHLRTSTAPSKAVYRLQIGTDALLRRAEEWVSVPDTAIGDYVGESLADYLRADRSEPKEHGRRLERFRGGFAQVLSTSEPFALVDTPALLRVHQLAKPQFTRVMTVLPFGDGHPARGIVKDLLLHEQMEEREIDDLFYDGQQARIEVSTFLAAPYQPMVFDSLMGPIADEWAQKSSSGATSAFWKWRRARPLRQFIPVDPVTRMEMVRGWFVARALGQISDQDFRGTVVAVFVPGEGQVPFPHPFLGPPLLNRDEVLPAVLEALPIAMLDSTRRGELALQPYWRLAELGRSTHPDIADSEFHRELLTWIRDGRVAPKAPTPGERWGGTATTSWQERLEAMVTQLDRNLAHYEELDARSIDARNVSYTSRSWELAPDILLALAQLREMARRMEKLELASDVG